MKTKRRCSLIYHQLGTCNFRFFVYGYFLVLIFNVCISISVFLSIYCFFSVFVSRGRFHTRYLSIYHYITITASSFLSPHITSTFLSVFLSIYLFVLIPLSFLFLSHSYSRKYISTFIYFHLYFFLYLFLFFRSLQILSWSFQQNIGARNEIKGIENYDEIIEFIQSNLSQPCPDRRGMFIIFTAFPFIKFSIFCIIFSYIIKLSKTEKFFN